MTGIHHEKGGRGLGGGARHAPLRAGPGLGKRVYIQVL